MDFTLDKFAKLVKAIQRHKYAILRVNDVLEYPNKFERFVILRHDVDSNAENALKMAKLENALGIKSTYYFRTTKQVFDKEIIAEISNMGHEIGYHYEVLAKSKGDHEKAIKLFNEELKEFLDFVPITTITMHGSPLSKWNDSTLWEKYDYKKLGIKGDSVLSLDFNEIQYFTDTGRRWDGERFNIRDRVKGRMYQNIKTTDDLIDLFNSSSIDKIMINTHPQRWNDQILHWILEYLLQNIKNRGKWMLRKWRLKSS